MYEYIFKLQKRAKPTKVWPDLFENYVEHDRNMFQVIV